MTDNKRERPPDSQDDERRRRDAYESGGDFADEHTSPTVADEMDGGPEGEREPESPKGRGGDGGMD
ncbi:hypothetical protein G1H11_06465 [Phytoactinopolyspora alkaliphila]|uniref:Uncharacterized protein n=1 Tax=Phytoactinopolyspora alkaliphila TaxID=1783498 RepID=A0A6N9YIX6_9ACTN|nr:hypothetical protein [Phytoactinopolyspora alkaliphila]NED94953.1 hypothetical protein [Phytoactinopolyspora alkaliphila]